MTAIPQSMRSIDITAPGGPDVLRLATRPVPRPGQGEVLVRTVPQSAAALCDTWLLA